MQRYREIVVAFSRNGFGYFVRELGLHKITSLPKRLFEQGDKEVHNKTTGERIRLFLEELGPTFIKLGQIASTRQDLIPKNIIEELEKLQDQVAPFSFSDVQEIIGRELQEPINAVFKSFDEHPIAAASIGQVHYGVLQSGQEVAVKIQRPNLEEKVHTDLEILMSIAKLAESRLEWAKKYQLSAIIKEFSNSLIAELDYTLEGRNAHRIAQQFKKHEDVVVPDVYWNLTTEKVLTMEYIKGIKLDENKKLVREGYNPQLIAEKLIQKQFQQILIDGFFHADPHPGNVMILPNHKILFMDFGMVGRLTSSMKDHLSSLIVAIMRQNTKSIIKAIYRMGIVSENVDADYMYADIDDLRDKYYDIPFSQVSIGEAINDLFRVATTHGIRIPTDLSLVGKSLLTLEGTVERLDPDISIVKIAEPFGKRLLKEKYQPKKVADEVYQQAEDYKDLILDFPDHINHLYKVIRRGKLPLEISVSRVEAFLRKLDRISNRLSFSIVLLAFSIIMVGLIIGSALAGESSYLWSLPVIEIGFVVAIGMFLWLLYSIFRSGRF
ncbi:MULTISPECIES: AarF/ABC1/UbiB kinase family protein [Oceanobacillus]|uniref:ABC transporter n=1 Tax=Oceanobacillus kimchii TaxID=746691 RepID=A0ABQ5TH04_9BACI|nr:MULTISPECIES: AarF/ABC1/UbiB kinase family protein [Oceanobacillus]MBT2598942.1 AarF/ABC1/UbiB kinase family protein [Oceanobacillus sp. ISL-74]MBT2651861.1 AarF/ABC1/UbiB kinase family protein [Oceanobacillus sp. ISL-73]MCT1576507.1 AarF/ABC1/UbiB kinase family protein [Oceanobacillus kimchii]MCT2136143.1 AarF/ABC1/UbiB kinase family protein [Oceanobacillus kimchii]GLO65750.1 ABC transporter [Oceanobacillus kimchii]